MDLAKLTNEKKLNLCRWYFKAGWFFFPFIWTVNAIWFYNDAFKKDEFDEQLKIRKYVIYSAIGASIWFIILTTWITIFQLNRAHWGEFGDMLSFIIPYGKP